MNRIKEIVKEIDRHNAKIKYEQLEVVFDCSQSMLEKMELPKNQKLFLEDRLKELKLLYYKAKSHNHFNGFENMFSEMYSISENVYQNNIVPMSPKYADLTDTHIEIMKVFFKAKEQIKESEYIRVNRFCLCNIIIMISKDIFSYLYDTTLYQTTHKQ